jgi:hypothetical protein
MKLANRHYTRAAGAASCLSVLPATTLAVTCSPVTTSKRMELSTSSRRRRFSFALNAVTVAAVLLPSVASAQPVLPPPEYGILVAAGQAANHFTAPGSYVLGGASISVVASPQASLLGHAAGNPAVGAGFNGGINYSFVVVGPRPDVLVPLFATFALHASAIGPTTNSSAIFQISFTENDFLERVDADTTHPSPADIFDTRSFAVVSGHIGKASLVIDGGSFGGFADAYADPFIFIDPFFLASNLGYSVFVSPGIGNAAPVSSVPEPEAYAMLLLGLGLLGSVARRRQHTAVA